MKRKRAAWDDDIRARILGLTRRWHPSGEALPTSSTELYSFCIEFRKVKTNRITGQSTATGKVPLIKERFLSKQAEPPLLTRLTSGIITLHFLHLVIETANRYTSDLMPLSNRLL